jgi:FAD/FMN-containing dehydrogenase
MCTAGVAARENFGRNIHFEPRLTFGPGDENELLQILDNHPGRRIRAVGRLHSWSEAAVAPDVLIDMRRLDAVRIVEEPGGIFAEVGAGCQIKRLIAELQRLGNWTLPSVGLITEQTIAGAAATGTHGSGRHSLSHYVAAIRLATYDSATGKATIRAISDGDELWGARCSLGSLGIVTMVRIAIRQQYYVEEHIRRYSDLSAVLIAERDYPLQQFFLIPWRWDYFVQHRREVSGPRSLAAPLYRAYWFAVMDVGFHMVIRFLARRSSKCTQFFFRRMLGGLVPRGWRVVDRSDRQLTMEHQLFRHIEFELFVANDYLPAAVALVIRLLKHAARRNTQMDTEAEGLLKRLRGSYVHHYPICIRKVRPDDTLISMTSGGREYYALSFISYEPSDRRLSFLQFAESVTEVLIERFDARPHWGKVCQLDNRQAEKLYPNLQTFRQLVGRFDPNGNFSNDWTEPLFHNGSPPPTTTL